MIRLFTGVCIAGLLGASAAAAQSSGLRVVEVGDGSQAFVVLHGGPGLTHEYLRPEWDVLAQRGRVLYYDQRGCGGSDRMGPLTWRRHVDDLEALLQDKTANQEVVVAGTSWGAMLALLYAYTHPERISAIVVSGLPPWEHLVDSTAVRYSRMPAAAQDSIQRSVERVAFDTYPVVDSITFADRSGVMPPSDRLYRRFRMGCEVPADVIMASLYDAPRLAELRSISVPTLIIDGDMPNPQGSGAADVAEVLPNATLQILPGTGHDPWLDRPEAFYELIDEFLNSMP